MIVRTLGYPKDDREDAPMVLVLGESVIEKVVGTTPRI